MNFKNAQQTNKTAAMWQLFAVIAICAIGAVTHASAQITVPPTPSTIAVQEGNSPYLVGQPSAARATPAFQPPTAALPGIRLHGPKPLSLPICSGRSSRSSRTSRASTRIPRTVSYLR